MVIVTFTPAVVKNGRRVDKQNITAQAVIFFIARRQGSYFFAIPLCIALTSSTIGMMRKARKSEMRYAFVSR